VIAYDAADAVAVSVVDSVAAAVVTAAVVAFSDVASVVPQPAATRINAAMGSTVSHWRRPGPSDESEAELRSMVILKSS